MWVQFKRKKKKRRMTDVIFTLRSELELFFHGTKYGIGTMKYGFYFHNSPFDICCSNSFLGRVTQRLVVLQHRSSIFQSITVFV